MNEIRTLRADEIECRVNQIKESNGKVGCSILLYKDARCDMRILDETFGAMNWKREHRVIGDRLYCSISVWDNEKCQWVSKEDVGTESYTEKEKGQASDSFKRSGTNWGIGRELYTSPFIWIPLSNKEYFKKNDGKLSTSFSFKLHVSEIEYNEKREITRLVLCDNDGNERYQYPQIKKKEENKEQKQDKQKNTKLEAAREKAKIAYNLLIQLNGGDKDCATEIWTNNYKKDQNDIVKMDALIIEFEAKLKQVNALDA